MSAHARQPIVAGNWKMNGDVKLGQSLSDAIGELATCRADVIVCPPSIYLSELSKFDFALGAQDVSDESAGAYTGEISANMLRDAGVQYVLVGHSERRQRHQESNKLVGAKALAALNAGLTPIVCVGESESSRQQGLVEDVIGAQVEAVIDAVGKDNIAQLVMAYEPVWAIGTGQTATPAMAQEVHEFIRRCLAAHSATANTVRIVYGGSVKGDNAKELFAQPDIDGGLIGGASLKPQEFVTICQAAN